VKSSKNKRMDPLQPFDQSTLCKFSCNSIFSIFSSLPKGIFSVSLFGLFLGAATTMVYSQIGLFMKYELHASEMKIAVIDGIVEFIAYAVRVFSGLISDYLRNRKLLLIIGCTLTLFMKPIYAIAQSSITVLIAQTIERIGNGFQAVPRDALIADLSPQKNLAQSFGFSRSLKTFGALMGGVIATCIMWLTADNFRIVFLCSTIAVFISILCLSLVKTKQELQNDLNDSSEKSTDDTKKIKNPFQKKYLKSLDKHFWKIVLLSVIFELGHFTESLLPIYAESFIKITLAGSISTALSIGQVLCSFPIGLYADKFGRGMFIRICILMMIAANVLFVSAQYFGSIIPAYVAAFLWGGQMTAVQGLFLSIISKRVDPHLRGTAIGFYYCSIGVSYLVASAIAGYIWSDFGSTYAFAYSIVFCVISLFLFRTLLPKKYEFSKEFTEKECL